MSRLLRHLVRVLVLALAPILVLASTDSARAATSYGDVKVAETLVFDGPDGPDPLALGLHVDCNVNGYFVTADGVGPGAGPSVFIKAKVSCATDYNVDSAVLGLRAEGTGCSFTWPVGEMDGAGVVSGNMLPDSAVDPASCVIDSVCGLLVVRSHTNPWMGSIEETVCASWPLGSPDEAVESGLCDYGTVQAPTFNGPAIVTHFDASADSEEHQEVLWDIQPGALPNGGTQWRAYAVVDVYRGTLSAAWRIFVPVGADLSFYPTHAVGGPAKPGSQTPNGPTVLPASGIMDVGKSNNWDDDGSPVYLASNIIGVGVFRFGPGVSGTQAGDSAAKYPTSLTQGLIGKNNPATCAFYWGAKLYDAPGNEWDTPSGPIPSAPEPEPDPVDPVTPVTPSDGCDFSFTNPATWATAGICKLVSLITEAVSLLGRILGALGGLAAAIGSAVTAAINGIVDAVMDGLSALFVPDDDAMEGMVEDFTADVQATDGWEWVGAVTDSSSAVSAPAGAAPLAYSGAGASFTFGGGCAGPAIGWDHFAEMGMPPTITPFQACTGITAQVAPIFKLLLTAMLVIATLIKCTSLIMMGLGVEKKAVAEPRVIMKLGEF